MTPGPRRGSRPAADVRQLLPVAREVDPLEVFGDLPDAEGRPAVRLSMVASLDGATAVDGRSGGLGGPADRRAYLTMRSLADVVLVAAGTVRAEGYGPPALPPALAEARAARGQGGLPRIAVVTRTCDLPWEAPLFAEPGSRPIVVTVADPPGGKLERAEAAADVVRAGEGSVDLAACLRALGERGARSVLAEGGPTLNGALAAAGLLDELCLTISPLLAGGDAKRIVAGPPLAPTSMAIRSLCEDGGLLFLRARPA
jgi:riboflavin-specific deaminase-like protein